MPGRHINQQQVSLFMTLRITHTQQTAAAKAGISVASACFGKSRTAIPVSPGQ